MLTDTDVRQYDDNTELVGVETVGAGVRGWTRRVTARETPPLVLSEDDLALRRLAREFATGDQ